MQVGALILAGGDSDRMGRCKAALPWGDSTLLLHAVETLLNCCYPVVVVARDEQQELPPLHTECEIAFDREPGAGPLSAIVSGMDAVAGNCEAVCVIGCDAPYFDAAAVAWLVQALGTSRGAVPVLDGVPNVLHGIYSLAIRDDIQRLLDGGERAAKALADIPGIRHLDAAEVDAFDPQRRFLTNLNTIEEYEQARAAAGS